mgnify:FL=1
MDGDDDKLEELWKKQYALAEFTDPSNFKSYDELKKRLNDVLGGEVRTTEMENTKTAEDVVDTPVSETPTTETSSESEESDALSYFEKLANE